MLLLLIGGDDQTSRVLIHDIENIIEHSLEPMCFLNESLTICLEYLNLKVQEVKKCQGHVLQLLQKSAIRN